MLWVLAGSTWAIALLSLLSLPYRRSTRLRKVGTVVAFAAVATATWYWGADKPSPSLAAAFIVMIGGMLFDDLISAIVQGRAAVRDQEAGKVTN